MAYYHVLLSFHETSENPRCVLADLSEEELRKRFVTPYRRGKDVLCGNEVVDVSRISKVTIVCTADTSTNELKRIQEKSRRETEEFNRTARGVKLVDLGRGHNLEDIGEAGVDVTSTYISGPPGYGDTSSVVTAVVNHPWGLSHCNWSDCDGLCVVVRVELNGEHLAHPPP